MGLFNLIYLLDIKTPLPQKIIDGFTEPGVRFSFYLMVFLLSYWDKTLALILTITILIINLDINNLLKISIVKPENYH